MGTRTDESEQQLTDLQILRRQLNEQLAENSFRVSECRQFHQTRSVKRRIRLSSSQRCAASILSKRRQKTRSGRYTHTYTNTHLHTPTCTPTHTHPHTPTHTQVGGRDECFCGEHNPGLVPTSSQGTELVMLQLGRSRVEGNARVERRCGRTNPFLRRPEHSWLRQSRRARQTQHWTWRRRSSRFPTEVRD